MLAQRESSCPNLTLAAWRMGGVLGVGWGGVTVCCAIGIDTQTLWRLVHIYHWALPSSPTHTLVQAAVISPAGTSSPVSRSSLPSSLAIHHTVSRRLHLELTLDHVPSLRQTSNDSLLTVMVFTVATGLQVTCPPPPSPFTHSAPASHAIPLLLLDATRHGPTSRPLSWLFSLLETLFPQIPARLTPFLPSGPAQCSQPLSPIPFTLLPCLGLSPKAAILTRMLRCFSLV